ncbi:MAG TPA: serine hydrolase domain-containing protein [Rectinemataceae bacterium]|nr:serine hydrolase domain-containing protein [Rectinemataceae bacterium]
MRILRRLLPVVVIAAAALVLLYLPEIGPERYTDLATYFRVERSRQAYTGYVVAAVASGAVLYVDGFGVDGTGRSLDEHSPVLLGSPSKTLTACAALTLARDGRLDLDKPVTTYLPWFGFAGGAGAAVSLRDLIAESSGVSDSSFDDVHEAAPDLESAVRSLTTAKQTDPAGSAFHYINTGYQAVGLVMEKVARDNFASIMKRRIFTPLGMNESSASPQVQGPELSVGSGSFFGATLPRPLVLRPFGAPSGYMVTTANDLGSYLAFLVAPEKARRAPLSPRTVRMLFQRIEPNINFGYGWFLGSDKGLRSAFHDGSLDGFSSRILLWPDQKAGIAVVATQASLLQSLIALPALTDGARRIMLEGSAPRPFPLMRLYVLLAVVATVHLLMLAIQTGAALGWAKDVKGRSEAKGVPGPIRFARFRALCGIPIRIAAALALPAALSYAFARAVTWKVAFSLEPGLMSWFVSACFFGLLRNAARLAWLRGAPLPPGGK